MQRLFVLSFLVAGWWPVWPAPGQPVAPSDSLSRETLSAFVDSFFVTQMDALHIPGAAVVVVRDSSVVLLRGYGYADLAAQTPVDPAGTLFQVASVSKPFTATAVLQLAGRGQVDLYADVNRYVRGFQIEEAFDRPVTLADLLTHTAGFDDRNIGYAARDAAGVRPLGAYLADRMPLRTLPPGTVTSYSNHGYGLAGHVVEVVSGIPFADYMEENVFAPLGMTRSTFRLPLPPTLAPHLATGYTWRGDTYAPVPLLYRNVPPAGALSTTARDMGAFLIAHLQEGRFGAGRILPPEAVRTMHRQQFTHHPRLPGYAFGFGVQYENGRRMLAHSGDVAGFGSLLFLIPEEHVGVFLTTNRLDNAFRQDFVRAFMDRFFPTAPPAVLQPSPGARSRLARFAGAYRNNRYARHRVENLFAFFPGQFHVGIDSAGYLTTQDGARWVEIEPLVFREAETEQYLAFRVDAAGRVTHLFRSMDLGSKVPVAYEKLSWYETPTFVNEVYLSYLLVLMLTWVVWPLAGLIRWGRRRWGRHAPRAYPAQARIALGVAALFGVLAGWFAFAFIRPGVQAAFQNGGDLIYGLPGGMKALLVLPFAQLVLVSIMAVYAVRAWRDGYWALPTRLHYTLFTGAAVVWMVFLALFDLIGFRY